MREEDILETIKKMTPKEHSKVLFEEMLENSPLYQVIIGRLKILEDLHG